MRRRWKALVVRSLLIWLAAFAALLFVGDICYWNCTSGPWRRILAGHDGRLIGSWTGKLKGEPMIFQLFPDGRLVQVKGRVQGGRYTWGTDADVVEFKWLANDHYATAKFKFRLSDDGSSLNLIPAGNYWLPGTWNRNP